MMRRHLRRDDVAVRQDIVEFGEGHDAIVAEIGDLHRCRPEPEHREPRSESKAVEIDEDVDLVCADRPGSVLFRSIADRDGLVEGGQDPTTDVAVIVFGRTIAEDLEAVAVVRLEQLCHEIGHRMPAIVRRHVTDAES